MNRNLDEVVASQNKMIERRGEKASGDDKQIRQLYEQHLRSIKAWIPKQPNFRVLEINYTDTISDAAGVAKRIKDFLGLPLDVTKMAGAVDEQLYRNRAERS